MKAYTLVFSMIIAASAAFAADPEPIGPVEVAEASGTTSPSSEVAPAAPKRVSVTVRATGFADPYPAFFERRRSALEDALQQMAGHYADLAPLLEVELAIADGGVAIILEETLSAGARDGLSVGRHPAGVAYLNCARAQALMYAISRWTGLALVPDAIASGDRTLAAAISSSTPAVRFVRADGRSITIPGRRSGNGMVEISSPVVAATGPRSVEVVYPLGNTIQGAAYFLAAPADLAGNATPSAAVYGFFDR